MLVLSRKKNESIIINGDIRIEVLQIRGKQIRLGITAPPNMKVLRGELPDRSGRFTGVASIDQPSINRDVTLTESGVIECDLPVIAGSIAISGV